ncbi:MAG: EAL domain-containing protein [Oscillibacter sp.]|nr:EAL domain-containing protein [Oscillibacter sp.]
MNEKDIEARMNPLLKRALDDVFNAFLMISGGAMISLMHIDGGFTRFTPAAVELFGLPGEYVPNDEVRWSERIHPEDRRRYETLMDRLIEGRMQNYDTTYRVRTKDGTYSAFRAVGASIRDEAGMPRLVGGTMVNQGVMDTTDPITILPNKYALNKALEELMEDGCRALILQVGFRRLSKINADYGYSFGNHVLRETAWLIQETVGARGSVYRMDNGTFAVLTTTAAREELAAVYDSLRLKFQRGVRVDGVRMNLTASGGMISVEDVKTAPETVRSCLRSAFRESKRYRHGELVDFNGSVRFDAGESMEMVNTIRDCIAEDCRGFDIRYQPVVDVRTDKLMGMEALLRWEGEPYGLVKPSDFLPILEKDFVFEELGAWIIRRVAEDGVRFLEKNPALRMSVNIAPSQLEDEFFLDTLAEILEDTGFPAEQLCLELSKGCRMLEMERLQRIVDSLHKMGLCVIIDDYGTGFESVGFLKKLAADYIKIDRDLVKDIERDAADRETVESLARCAEVRGTRAIVKGVETAAMRDILRNYEISGLQGNLYAMPATFEEVMERCFS